MDFQSGNRYVVINQEAIRMSFNCAFSTDKCCGAGEVHKYCSQQVQDRKEALEDEMKRLKCGKCDKCKVEGVELWPVQGQIWDLCKGCLKTYGTPKRYKKSLSQEWADAIRGEK